MLQNLEKEIDDVDAKIGDRWRLLDRFLLALVVDLILILSQRRSTTWNWEGDDILKWSG